PRPQHALDRRARQIRAGRAASEGRYIQALPRGSFPVGRRAGMFEWNPAVGEVLGEPAPGGKVQLVGLFQLREISLEARTFGEQFKNAALVEYAHVVLPDHVVDRR